MCKRGKRADIAALKAPDVLHTYCRAALGAGKQVGRLTFYPCPWGAHTRPKLEVTERDGIGVAMCRACDTGGTVFDVAAGGCWFYGQYDTDNAFF